MFSEILSDFGVLGNLTLVDSDSDYTVVGPGTAVGSTGNVSGISGLYTRPLLNLSKTAVNGTVYYDNGRFSARASVAYRSSYSDSVSGNSNVFEGYAPSFNVDASIRYKLNDMIEISIEGTNLTDDYRERWVNEPSKRGYENNHFGRVFMGGVRVRM